MTTEILRTNVNTLEYNPALCINCGMCSTVCPHGVFAPNGSVAQLVRPEACMECGACQQNCPSAAITVDSGVGCAAAMIYAALTGRKEPTRGPDAEPDGCGTAQLTTCCTGTEEEAS
ncbi:MAG TPA: mercury methylation ferredoxin HgcB [Phycisphaerae bacterium]|nr:mercury methylation ferredoxin HgcB [Phycisphaerae bacterium]